MRRRRPLFNRIVVLSFLVGISPAWAQDPPSGILRDSLETVEIRARRIQAASPLEARWRHYLPGGRMDTVSRDQRETYGLETMESLISDQYPVFVHRYGVNGMASLRLRGSSSAQTQVFWNGIPIQNPAHGQADLSVLAVELMEDIRLVYGGGGALWGSGQVGGGLILGSSVPLADSGRHSTLRGRFGAGSFGQKQGSLKWVGAGPRAGISIGYRQAYSGNDFPYVHPDQGNQRMAHARTGSRAFMIHAAHRAGTWNAQTSLWWQDGRREIPPALFESYSAKTLEDQSLRWSISMDRPLERGRIYFLGGWARDQSRFADQAIDLHSGILSHQLYGEAGWEKNLPAGGRWRIFVPLQFSQARTDDGKTSAMQQQNALTGAISLPFADYKGLAAVSLRWNLADGNSLILPSASLGYTARPWIRFRGSMQRSYRLPNLFELYIQPGGNPDLRPEQGWSLDMGTEARWPMGENGEGSHESSVFFRWVEDWIFWTGGSIWTPHNLHAVFSRGWETQTRWKGKFRIWQWTLGLSTAYILSTQGPSADPGFPLEGYQIPYSPRYRAQAMARLHWRNLSLQYTHGYTGYRFTTLDESQYLQPYSLGHLRLGWEGHHQRRSWQVKAQILNLWDADHQLAAHRPMPGRHYMLGIQWEGSWPSGKKK